MRKREKGSEESSSSAISAKSRVNVQPGSEIVSVSVPLPDLVPAQVPPAGAEPKFVVVTRGWLRAQMVVVVVLLLLMLVLACQNLYQATAATIATTILVELVAVRFECTKKSIGLGPCSVGHHDVSSTFLSRLECR